MQNRFALLDDNGACSSKITLCITVVEVTFLGLNCCRHAINIRGSYYLVNWGTRGWCFHVWRWCRKLLLGIWISVRSVRRFWFRIRGKSSHCDRSCSDKPDESYLPKVDKLVGHVDMAGVVQPKERQTGKQIVNVYHKRTLLFILHWLFFSSQLNSGRKGHNFISYGGCTRKKNLCQN